MTQHLSQRYLPTIIVLIQLLTFTRAQPVHTQARPNVSLEHYLPSTNIPLSSTLLADDDDYDAAYDDDMEGEMHGDGDGFQVMSSTIPMPHDGFDAEMNNNTMNYHEESDGQEYQDLEEDNDDHIYADTMSVNRPESKRPVSDLNPNKPSVTSTTPARTVFGAFNHWPNLFSKPTILVGIVGGVVLGILSTVVLIMFIIYRMRKRDEGSYVLDEGPRKSPSHAYTRVSSREFFA